MKKLGLTIALILEIFIFFEGTLPYSMSGQSDVWLINVGLIILTTSVLLNEVSNER